jgi:hypothetical protein
MVSCSEGLPFLCAIVLRESAHNCCAVLLWDMADRRREVGANDFKVFINFVYQKYPKPYPKPTLRGRMLRKFQFFDREDINAEEAGFRVSGQPVACDLLLSLLSRLLSLPQAWF